MDSRLSRQNSNSVTPKKSDYRDLVFKFLIIGDYGVGKTAIVRRYSEGKFSSNYKITIGADFSIKILQWDKTTKISLQLWDIAGHERFGYMTRVYYKYAIGCAIVFDVSRSATFQSVKKWLRDVRENVVSDDGRPIPVVLLANKWDIEESGVSSESIEKFCAENKVNAWFKTSAKENLNIDEAMKYLIEEALKLSTEKKPSEGFKINTESNKPTGSSCCSS